MADPTTTDPLGVEQQSEGTSPKLESKEQFPQSSLAELVELTRDHASQLRTLHADHAALRAEHDEQQGSFAALRTELETLTKTMHSAVLPRISSSKSCPSASSPASNRRSFGSFGSSVAQASTGVKAFMQRRTSAQRSSSLEAKDKPIVPVSPARASLKSASTPCLRKEQPSLREAVEKGQEDVVGRLLRGRANPEESDEKGVSLLHLAAFGGKASLCRLLMRSKASVNASDQHGQTPLFFAPTKSICEILHDQRADTTIINNKGQSALHFAGQAGMGEVLLWLCSHLGRDVLNLRDAYNATGAYYAQSSGVVPEKICRRLQAAASGGIGTKRLGSLATVVEDEEEAGTADSTKGKGRLSAEDHGEHSPATADAKGNSKGHSPGRGSPSSPDKGSPARGSISSPARVSVATQRRSLAGGRSPTPEKDKYGEAIRPLTPLRRDSSRPITPEPRRGSRPTTPIVSRPSSRSSTPEVGKVRQSITPRSSRASTPEAGSFQRPSTPPGGRASQAAKEGKQLTPPRGRLSTPPRGSRSEISEGWDDELDRQASASSSGGVSAFSKALAEKRHSSAPSAEAEAAASSIQAAFRRSKDQGQMSPRTSEHGSLANVWEASQPSKKAPPRRPSPVKAAAEMRAGQRNDIKARQLQLQLQRARSLEGSAASSSNTAAVGSSSLANHRRERQNSSDRLHLQGLSLDARDDPDSREAEFAFRSEGIDSETSSMQEAIDLDLMGGDTPEQTEGSALGSPDSMKFDFGGLESPFGSFSGPSRPVSSAAFVSEAGEHGSICRLEGASLPDFPAPASASGELPKKQPDVDPLSLETSSLQETASPDAVRAAQGEERADVDRTGPQSSSLLQTSARIGDSEERAEQPVDVILAGEKTSALLETSTPLGDSEEQPKEQAAVDTVDLQTSSLAEPSAPVAARDEQEEQPVDVDLAGEETSSLPEASAPTAASEEQADEQAAVEPADLQTSCLVEPSAPFAASEGRAEEQADVDPAGVQTSSLPEPSARMAASEEQAEERAAVEPAVAETSPLVEASAPVAASESRAEEQPDVDPAGIQTSSLPGASAPTAASEGHLEQQAEVDVAHSGAKASLESPHIVAAPAGQPEHQPDMGDAGLRAKFSIDEVEALAPTAGGEAQSEQQGEVEPDASTGALVEQQAEVDAVGAEPTPLAETPDLAEASAGHQEQQADGDATAKIAKWKAAQALKMSQRASKATSGAAPSKQSPGTSKADP